MNRLAVLAVLIGSLVSFQAEASAQPAPAETGVFPEGPALAQSDGQQDERQEEAAAAETKVSKTPEQQIADLQAEIKTLKSSLTNLADAQKAVEELQSRVKILEGENTNLSARIKTLESAKDALDRRVMTLEAVSATTQETLAKLPNKDSATQQTTAKFVNAAVRFHNHEGRNLKMNVNGVWHTLKPGENDILVPYGPVHIYRYTDAEPKPFKDWKPHQDGYIMEFDVGTPAEK
jgi:hypothetical protein